MISSSSNPTIKSIRQLRQRKAREESSLFFIEGIRLVGEAVQLGATIESLIIAPELLHSQFAQELVEDLKRVGVSIIEVTKDVFANLSQKDGPQGIAAVIQQCWVDLEAAPLDRGLCWVALIDVADPGNLGTILRTTDAVGANGVILLDNSTDPYDPAALRASMGAIFAQQVVRTSFTEFIAWKQAKNVFLVGTSDKANTDYQATKYPQPLVLLMGSERQGIAPEQQSACDLMVSLPMLGRSDSLNLAVATGVMLYEICNQQRS